LLRSDLDTEPDGRADLLLPGHPYRRQPEADRNLLPAIDLGSLRSGERNEDSC